MSWAWVLDRWGDVAVDMADLYGIDLWDPAILARPWPGVRTLIWSLLTRPSRLSKALEKE